MFSTILRSSPKAVSNFAKMAAIARISSLQEWEEEWDVLEEETQKFKQTKFQDYLEKMDEFHASQKSCVSAVNLQKRRLADFRQSLQRFMKGELTDEQKAHGCQLQLKIAELERKIKFFETSLPSQAGPALWLPPRRLARPESPMESQTSTTTSLYRSASASGSVEDHVASKENKTSTKVRSPNWSDAEIRFLIGLWKDRYPISKRHNSAVWESIAKELNSLLREQGLASIRTAAQCKAKKKNLADDYKRVKDRNNKSGNGSGTFTYFEELNEILGCRAKITPKTVIECGFDDNNSAIPGPSCQAMEELSESGDSESDEEEQTLSQVPFRCELAAKKEKSPLASTLNSSKQNGQKSFKRKPGSQPDNNASSFSNQPPVKRLKRRESSGQSSGSAEYFSFLNESQKRDHEFFERLAEKEAEREIKSQELMVSMVKEVAKIFKGE